jgi:hypothetical protein
MENCFNPYFAFNPHDRKLVTTKDENIVVEGSRLFSYEDVLKLDPLKSVILQPFLRVLILRVLRGCKMTDFNGPVKNNFVHHEFSA